MRVLACSNGLTRTGAWWALACLLACCAAAGSQQTTPDAAVQANPPAAMAFDKVHLYPDTGDGTGEGFLWWDPASANDWLFANVSSSNLIANAYGIGMRQIIGLPQWAEIDRYSLTGSLAADKFAEFEQFPVDEQSKQERLIIQAVLADRYHLQAHRETREMPVYELVIARGGLKIAERDMDGHSGGSFFRPRDWWNYGTMEDLACKLQRPLGVVVVDKTGLGPKRFHYHLEWSPDELSGATDRGAYISTTLEKQLGLKLVAATAPVEVLVIEHIEKPKTGFWQRASSQSSR